MSIKSKSDEISTTGDDCSKSDSKVEEVRSFALRVDEAIHCGQQGEAKRRVWSFRRIQKRIFDPRFAGFLGQKKREIRNWICNLDAFRKRV